MHKVKTYLKMISPFNNMDEMPIGIYIVKKLLAFFIVYMAAALVGEGIVIAGLSIGGYDFLHGEMPNDNVMALITYYGYAIYLLFAILYCKYIEKRPIGSMGFTKRVWDYLTGSLIAIVMLALIIAFVCILGGATFGGVVKNIDAFSTSALLGGFMIQGAVEEILSRGLLMSSLQKKVNVPLAVFVSSTVFAYPHFSTLFEAEMKYAILGVVNLYLVSVIFSLLMLWRKNIWIACGLHSIWNFVLYVVFGLTLSGSNTQNSGIVCFGMSESSIINGGQYGLEASIVTTMVLTVVVIFALVLWDKEKRRTANGIQ